MLKSKGTRVLCIAWIIFLVVVLNVLPAVRSMGVESNTIYYASNMEITIEKKVYASSWNASKTIEVDFTIKDPLYSVSVTAPFEWEILANYGRWQVTRVKYMLYVNGELSRVIIEDLVGTSFNAIGTYENKPLNGSLLKVGANKFTLKIDVVSTCDDFCQSSFKLIIRNLRVQNHVLDLDMDGIWDNVDVLPINNTIFTALFSALSTPIIGYLGSILERKFRKNEEN